MAQTSQARSKFQATYIDRLEDDTLSSIVKGTAIWRKDPGRETEGYYVYLSKIQEYHPIHYIEEDCLWAFIAVNERNKWYTIKPVPRKHGLGPQLQPTSGIDIDDDDNTDTSTTTPITSTTSIQPTTHTPVITSQPIMSQAGTSTTLTTAPTIPSGTGTTVPPSGSGGGGGGRGGGGGGGGGGTDGGPPHANGRLEGNPPFEFTGDWERSKAFMLAFQIYRGMNPNAEVMTNPYRRTMTFLSYIRGKR